MLVVPALGADEIHGQLLRPLQARAGGRRTGEGLGARTGKPGDVVEQGRVGRRPFRVELADLQRLAACGRAVAAGDETCVKIGNGRVRRPVGGEIGLRCGLQRRIAAQVSRRISAPSFAAARAAESTPAWSRVRVVTAVE